MSESIVIRRASRGSARIVRIPTEPRVVIPAAEALPVFDDGVMIPLAAHAPVIEERTLEEEYRRGLTDGRRLGAEEAAHRFADDTARTEAHLAEFTDRLKRELGGFCGGVEKEAFRFALAVASRILHREISLDNTVVIAQIKEAMHRITGVDTIKLRVHPDDEALVRAHRDAILGAVDSVRDVVIEGDSSVEMGGCMIESQAGNVDARISTQLRQIEMALFGSSDGKDVPA